MPKYLVLQVPYDEKESVFLLQAVQTAVKTYREFQGGSPVGMGVHSDPATDESPYLLVEERNGRAVLHHPS